MEWIFVGMRKYFTQVSSSEWEWEVKTQGHTSIFMLQTGIQHYLELSVTFGRCATVFCGHVNSPACLYLTYLSFSGVCHVWTAPSRVTGANTDICAHRMPRTALSRKAVWTCPRYELHHILYIPVSWTGVTIHKSVFMQCQRVSSAIVKSHWSKVLLFQQFCGNSK